jgi:hypothetical protein
VPVIGEWRTDTVPSKAGLISSALVSVREECSPFRGGEPEAATLDPQATWPPWGAILAARRGGKGLSIVGMCVVSSALPHIPLRLEFVRCGSDVLVRLSSNSKSHGARQIDIRQMRALGHGAGLYNSHAFINDNSRCTQTVE